MDNELSLIFKFDLGVNLVLDTASSRRDFNISWLVGGHPILDPYMLMSEANRTLDILLNLLRSSSSLPGSVTIAVVNG